MTKLYLNPSKALKYEVCPRQYYYQYVERLEAEERPANLAFGTTLHGVLTDHILNTCAGVDFDPRAEFQRRWSDVVESQTLAYPSTMGPDDLERTGTALAAMWPEYWDGLGWIPVLDAEGNPMVERRMVVDLGPQMVLRLQPDLLVYDRNGDVIAPDLKTCAQPSTPEFAKVADQLTAYQLGVERSDLGIGEVAQVGFVDLVKRKVTPRGRGPEIMPPNLVPRRDTAQLIDYEQKLAWCAEDIRRGRFPRRSLHAFNSPCQLCDFRALCQDGDQEGVVVRPQRQTEGQQAIL